MEATEGLADTTSDASQSVKALAQLANSERVSHILAIENDLMHEGKRLRCDA